MKNHSEKARDMGRSILPSKGSIANLRRRAHHHDRAATRISLHDAIRSGDFDGADTSAPTVRDIRIRELVSYRRRADKSGPLVNWAVRKVEIDERLHNAPLDARLAYFAKLLPDGLIGDHAIKHIEYAIKPDEPAAPRSGNRGYIDATQFRIDGNGQKIQLFYFCRYRDSDDEVRALTLQILENGDHRRVNCEIRQLMTSCYGLKAHDHWRLLLGEHDVESFVKDVGKLAGGAAIRGVLRRVAGGPPPQLLWEFPALAVWR